MTKRILPLLLILLAVAIGLTLPGGVVAIQSYRMEGKQETLGLALDAVSLESGLTQLEKLELLNAEETEVLALAEEEVSQWLLTMGAGTARGSGKMQRQLLNRGNQAVLIRRLTLTDNWGNDWVLYVDEETQAYLGVSLVFCTPEDSPMLGDFMAIEETGTPEEYWEMAMSEFGIDVNTGQWAVDMALLMLVGQRNDLWLADYWYDIDFEEREIIIEMEDATDSYLTHVSWDRTGCRINCNRILEK